MATQTAVSEHSTLPDQQVKEKVQDEVKPVEDTPVESLASEEIKKADVIAELETIIQEAKEPDVEEIPKVYNSVIPAAPLAEPEEKFEDKEIEPSLLEEPKITDEEPSPAAPLTEAEDKNIETPVTEESKINGEESEPVAEDVPSSAAPLAEPEVTIEDKNIEPPVIEEQNVTVEEKIEDKNIEPPVIEEAKTEAADLPIVPPAEPEATIEEKSRELPELEEVKTDKTPVVDTLAKDIVEVKEAQIDLPVQESEPEPEPAVAEEEIPMSFPAVEEKPEEEYEQMKEEVEVVEPKENVNLGSLMKEDASVKEEPIKIETVMDVPKGDENSEKSTLTDSISAPEAAEMSLDVETISREVELVAENEKEVIKEQAVAAKTNGDELVTKESVEEEQEPKKTEAEEKGEETSLTEETKVAEDLPKEEVKAKSLISKLKSSLGKAKKAIIGKSPNPKATTPPSDTKGEVKV